VHIKYPPENKNCDLAQRIFCAILTFSRVREIFAVERNFRATLATFVSYKAAWKKSILAEFNLVRIS